MKLSYNKIKIILYFGLTAAVLLVVSAILMLDKASPFIPNKYKPFFERTQDIIFGKIQIIEIQGNKLLSKHEILPHIYTNAITTDDIIQINSDTKIKKNLKENSLILKVNTKRFLPNKLVIYIKEKDVILKFFHENSGKFFTLTTQGEVLSFYKPNLTVPMIVGEFNPEDVILFYNTIKERNLIFENLTDIVPFFKYKFNIVLKRKTLVLLPEDNISSALQTLESLIQHNKILEKNIKVLDLRVKNKIVIEYFQNNEALVFKPVPFMTTFTWN